MLTRDWQGMRDMSARLLKERSGRDVSAWNRRIKAVLAAAAGLGEVVIQARKTFVSLVTPRRTFARVQATTRTRVDLGLRLERQRPAGRMRSSKIHDTMRHQISLASRDEVDSEVLGWLQREYDQNC